MFGVDCLDLVQLHCPPSPVYSNPAMFAALDAIKAKGLRIPEDVAIIGFTDGDAAAFVTPRLTAIMDKAHEQGAKACELLMRNINGDNKIYKEVVPMILKIRESSEKL